MDWEKPSTSNEGKEMYVRVMSDEQMEVLRRQISVYATICEQLVEMHKALTAHRDPLTGMKMGNMYSDPLLTSGGHKITGRQRWSPTVGQLQILERLFEQDNGAPNKKRIKEITSELAQHGQISETNVYNWFQNRRARSKRKQTASSSNTESEVEAEVESPEEKRSKPDKKKIHPRDGQPPRIEETSQNPSSCENTPNPTMNQPLDGAEGLSWGPYCVWAGGV